MEIQMDDYKEDQMRMENEDNNDVMRDVMREEPLPAQQVAS